MDPNASFANKCTSIIIYGITNQVEDDFLLHNTKES